jgi:hypothetical protein
MGNVQVHVAVGAQVAPQFITIPPPLFRSSQGEVAAHLAARSNFTCYSQARVHLWPLVVAQG